MQEILTNMASAEAAAQEKDFFTALGIDWQLLIIQTVAFLVLLWFLAKFVYPPLTRMLEKRDEAIEAGVRAASEAEKKAAATQDETAKLLKQARKEATDIVSTAKDEAAAIAASADVKAKERAERLVADAHAQVEKDIVAARKALHNETIELVAMATEKVVGETISAKVDSGIIAAAVKDAR